MLQYLRALDWKTLLAVILVWYVLPVFGGPELMRWALHGASHGESPTLLHNTLATILLAWWAVAPIGCGYSVARLAKQLPQLTALLAVALGSALQAARNNYFGWIGNIIWVLLSFGGAGLGFFLWRLQDRHRS